MGNAEAGPYIRVYLSLLSHDKWLCLPSDKARVALLHLLAAAKTRRGQFSSEVQLKHVMGVHSKQISALRAMGFLDGLSIHDWPDYQTDPEHGDPSAAGRASAAARRLKYGTAAPLTDERKGANDHERRRSQVVPRTSMNRSRTETETEKDKERESNGVAVTAVYETWLESGGWSKSQRGLTPLRREKILARLKSFPVADVTDAAKGWVNDPWPDRVRQNDLTLLLRNDDQCEKFRDLYRAGPPRSGKGEETLDELRAEDERAAVENGWTTRVGAS